ncbi:hypothetical protein, partial [Streptomyces griseorubiginosus]|uniref:hypothetical protein n=1 Tax=Streptomyces griseorubiginosus TaxID=67304 RepID=UPI001AD6D2B7
PTPGPHTALPGSAGHRRHPCTRAHANQAALRLTARVQQALTEAARRPDRGDISTTTVIIWVAAVTGAVLIAGTIAVVIAKYNGKLAGL